MLAQALLACGSYEFSVVETSSDPGFLESEGKFIGAATAPNGLVVFPPWEILGGILKVGLFDPVTELFSTVDVTAEVTADGTSTRPFSGAVTANNGLIVFVPNAANAVGLFNAGTQSLSTYDISSYGLPSGKFIFGAPAPTGNVVYFAPFAAGAIGKFDAGTSAFTTIDISSYLPSPAPGYKFCGAALVAGRVVFAPRTITTGIGVLDTSTDSFKVVNITGMMPEHPSNHGQLFAGATATADGKVVMAPRGGQLVGVYDVQAEALSTIDVTNSGMGVDEFDSQHFYGAAPLAGGSGFNAVLVPSTASGVCLVDTTTMSFSYVNISGSVDWDEHTASRAVLHTEPW